MSEQMDVPYAYCALLRELSPKTIPIDVPVYHGSPIDTHTRKPFHPPLQVKSQYLISHPTNDFFYPPGASIDDLASAGLVEFGYFVNLYGESLGWCIFLTHRGWSTLRQFEFMSHSNEPDADSHEASV